MIQRQMSNVKPLPRVILTATQPDLVVQILAAQTQRVPHYATILRTQTITTAQPYTCFECLLTDEQCETVIQQAAKQGIQLHIGQNATAQLQHQTLRHMLTALTANDINTAIDLITDLVQYQLPVPELPSAR